MGSAGHPPRPTGGKVLSQVASLGWFVIRGPRVAHMPKKMEFLSHSPGLVKEWPALLEVFSDEELAPLVDVSRSSLKRYAAKQRPTPLKVAQRLHCVCYLC